MPPFKSEQIVIVYDAECPFCANYVAMMNLKSVFNSIELIDARNTNNKYVMAIKKKELDLNKGMVVILNNDYFYGDEAIWVLAKFTETKGFFLKVNAVVFSSKVLTKALYPLMRMVRRITLFFLGKKLI
jgi:predicted DCC family thiol-disulfide oxidoreductase YuxK